MNTIRAQNPTGRFLQLDKNTGLWFEIGDAQAYTKTRQGLRETRVMKQEWIYVPGTTCTGTAQSEAKKKAYLYTCTGNKQSGRDNNTGLTPKASSKVITRTLSIFKNQGNLNFLSPHDLISDRQFIFLFNVSENFG